MIIYAIFTILIDFHSQKWINIYLFGLVVTSVKTHILVPRFSIYHIFPYIIKFLCCLLILFQLFALNLQCIQNHLYNIFE